MSVCTFIASNRPLKEVAPEKEYPIEINLDKGAIDDGWVIIMNMKIVQLFIRRRFPLKK